MGDVWRGLDRFIEIAKRAERAEDLEVENAELRASLAAAVARNAHLEHTLKQIAKRDDTEMAQARTLHYDMRGWARAALEAEDQRVSLPGARGEATV